MEKSQFLKYEPNQLRESLDKKCLPNLYEILGLSVDICDKPKCEKIIRKAYIKLMKMNHPSKPIHIEPEDNKIFELISNAYDILIDKKQRDAYNNSLYIHKSLY